MVSCLPPAADTCVTLPSPSAGPSCWWSCCCASSSLCPSSSSPPVSKAARQPALPPVQPAAGVPSCAFLCQPVALHSEPPQCKRTITSALPAASSCVQSRTGLWESSLQSYQCRRVASTACRAHMMQTAAIIQRIPGGSLCPPTSLPCSPPAHGNTPCVPYCTAWPYCRRTGP
jgi:hypothetical protein